MALWREVIATLPPPSHGTEGDVVGSSRQGKEKEVRKAAGKGCGSLSSGISYGM